MDRVNQGPPISAKADSVVQVYLCDNMWGSKTREKVLAMKIVFSNNNSKGRNPCAND